MDLACTLAFCALALMVAIAYAVRVTVAGAAHHARVEAEGSSALMSKTMMEMLMWSVQPAVTTLARLRITADTVTYTSLVLGLAAGGALATGHFGVGAMLALAAACGDAVDGLLARHLGTGSAAGEVLDAAVDRYVDFALVGGLALYFRADVPRLTLALLALQGGFMVSYSSAKAEALHVTPPRGSMRRVERAALLVVASALTPLVGLFGSSVKELPILLALGAIGVVGNVSAIRRLAVIRAAVRERAAVAPLPRAAE